MAPMAEILVKCDDQLGQVLVGIFNRVVAIERKLNRIEALIINEGKIIMSELDDALQAVVDQLGQFETDLARELADFGAAISGKLTDAERAQFALIAQKLANAQAEIDAVDPAQVPPVQQAPTATESSTLQPTGGEQPAEGQVFGSGSNF